MGSLFVQCPKCKGLEAIMQVLMCLDPRFDKEYSQTCHLCHGHKVVRQEDAAAWVGPTKAVRKTRFGRMLTRARRTRGLGREDVAERLGIVGPSYTLLETGTNLPSYPHLLKLCRIFKFPLDAAVRAVAHDAKGRPGRGG